MVRRMSRFAKALDRAAIERTLVRYVAIHSVNPAIDDGPGESAFATAVHDDLVAMGLDVVRDTVTSGGRDNIVAVLDGNPDGPVVMYHAHLDTVGFSGKAFAEPMVLDGMVYGRGSCDTKGSVVAMLEALRLLSDVPMHERATIMFVGGIDEEVGGTGARTLIERFSHIDMAIIGEPTSLELTTAHKGVLRFDIATIGTPAHSSRPELGHNAINAMARVLDALEVQYRPTLAAIEHPLVGSPTISVSTIRGGTALNVVPAECVISVDRRVVPGEDHEVLLAEFDELLSGVDVGGCTIERRPVFLATSGLDTPTDHPLVEALQNAKADLTGDRGIPIGVTFGSDASWFEAAGIACVVFGPGSIDQAHSDDEWVPIEEVAVCGEILAQAGLHLSQAGRR